MLVRRDGGGVDFHRIRDNARMNVRVWSDSRDDAQDGADAVRAALRRQTVSNGLAWVQVDEQSCVRVFDDDRQQHGWMVVVDITVKATEGLVL